LYVLVSPISHHRHLGTLTSNASTRQIVVTGAATGIGRGTAQVLASRGAILSIADLNKENLDETLASLHPSSDPKRPHFATHLDVSSSSAVNQWIEDTVRKLGPLSGAANLAGVSLGLNSRPIRGSSDQDWDFVMNVNARGVFYCIRAQLALGGLVDGGSIVNVASVSGLRGLANTGSYGASKHAVVGLTRTAAREEGPNGIRVNCVAPGKSSQ